MEQGQRPIRQEVKGKSKEVRSLWAVFPSLAIQDDLLVRLPEEEAYPNRRPQEVAPEIKKDIFHYLHSTRLGGHQGVGRKLGKSETQVLVALDAGGHKTVGRRMHPMSSYKERCT